VSELEEIWVPLVDEPIGSIVEQVQAADPELNRLVGSPRRLLAFKTFAYIRVGILLGQLLVDHDVEPYDGSDTWVDQLLRESKHREAVEQEIRAVAAEIAADPAYAEDEGLGPDEGARERFRAFAKQRLEQS
jgi:hypothetical protein